MRPLDLLRRPVTFNRGAWVAAGLTLAGAGVGLKKHGAVRAALLAISAIVLGRALSVKALGKNVSRHQLQYGSGERDRVDEASWESFPASDPPSYSPHSV